MKSKGKYHGDVVVVDDKSIHILCMSLDLPSQQEFPSLLQSIKKRTGRGFKCVAWTPYTYPKGHEYKWRSKGGGYQGL